MVWTFAHLSAESAITCGGGGGGGELDSLESIDVWLLLPPPPPPPKKEALAYRWRIREGYALSNALCS